MSANPLLVPPCVPSLNGPPPPGPGPSAPRGHRPSATAGPRPRPRPSTVRRRVPAWPLLQHPPLGPSRFPTRPLLTTLVIHRHTIDLRVVQANPVDLNELSPMLWVHPVSLKLKNESTIKIHPYGQPNLIIHLPLNSIELPDMGLNSVGLAVIDLYSLCPYCLRIVYLSCRRIIHVPTMLAGGTPAPWFEMWGGGVLP